MTKVNPHIFRAYDIRGKAIADDPAKVDLSPDSVYAIMRGIATYMRRKLGVPHDMMLHVVIGRDGRLTSPALLEVAVEALRDTHCKVADIGLATSPMVYYAVCTHGFDVGLVITASHNHKDDNGIKIVEKNAHSVCGPELQDILKLVQEGDFDFFLEEKYAWTDGKSGAYYEMPTVFEEYMKEVKLKLPLFKNKEGDALRVGKGESAHLALRVAVDTGNGVVGKFIGPLLKNMGCEVVELYTELDGNYPNHEANPEYEENLRDLMKTVVEKKCDIGFGFDGDGDRVGVIDEKGKHYNADEIIILLARDMLKRHPGAPIVFDVKCSLMLEKEIKKAGGLPIVERTGHSFIENRMHRENAILAGEVSGHIFIAEDYYGFDDAMFAAAKIVKILSDRRAEGAPSPVPFSYLLADLPETFTTSEIKVPCPDDKKFDIVNSVTKYFQKTHRCLTLDGAKIHFNETDWGLVRPSNTSAYLTLRFEASSKDALKRIQREIAAHLKIYPELDTSWTNFI